MKFLDGSEIAKNGFRNEIEIVRKFNDWKPDVEAQAWLTKMGYPLHKIEYVKADLINGTYKSDVNVKVQVKLKAIVNVENIQVKLVSSKRGFNQIDKRWLKTYQEMWLMPDDVVDVLKYFTGERPPYKKGTRDDKRMFLDEMSAHQQRVVVNWFKNHLILVITDVIKGRGQFCAEWILVAQKVEENARWVLRNINEVIQYYYHEGEVVITPRGSLKLGRVTLQRKGGDGGKPSANMLQFKIDPAELFDGD